MTDTTLKLTEAFNRHNSLYNALLGNLNTLTTARTEEVTITLDAGKSTSTNPNPKRCTTRRRRAEHPRKRRDRYRRMGNRRIKN